MDHVTKSGAAKLLASCDLLLTGRSVVSRVITDLAVLDVAGAGFDLGVEFAEVVAKTDALVFDRRQMRRAATFARERVASSV